MSARFVPSFRRRAVTGAFVVVTLPVLLGFAALAIDVGSIAAAKTELQNAVDAAVLAGVQDLNGEPPDAYAAEQSALNIIVGNLSYGYDYAQVVGFTVVEFGTLDPNPTGDGEVFQPGAGWEAIRVTVQLDRE